MTAEIICVGTELLLGDIVNTNAQFLSKELAELGISVMHQHVVGDNVGRLRQLVQSALARSELLIFSGGLGPTADDLTKETVAECFGDPLAFDAEEWDKITGFFARIGRPTAASNRKQAMVPTLGHKIVNDHGTAPGCWFEKDDRIAVLMPGVPHEMKAMWKNGVRPLLEQHQNCTIRSSTLRVLGGESDIETAIRPLLQNENPTAAIYCKTGECEVRITARAASADSADAMCRTYAKEFEAILGDAIYDSDVPGLEYTLVRLLTERGKTLSTAESLTGGTLAGRITAVPGASRVFGFGFVTYAEAAKSALLGVDPAVIAEYNVVSAPVAAQMALGALRVSGADFALALTGIAGPDGGTEERPVGTVYAAAACREGVYVRRLALGFRERENIRTRSSQHALDMARRLVLGLPLPEAVFFAPETPAAQMVF